MFVLLKYLPPAPTATAGPLAVAPVVFGKPQGIFTAALKPFCELRQPLPVFTAAGGTLAVTLRQILFPGSESTASHLDAQNC